MTPTDELIGGYERAAADAATAVERELELLDRGPALRAQLVRALAGALNPATGRPHSATSADAAVDAEPQWLAHRSEVRQAVRARLQREAVREAAWLRARAAVGLADGARLDRVAAVARDA